MAGGGSKPGERRGGRQPGTPNKRTLDGEAYARAIVEDPKGVATLLRGFRQGKLPTPVLLHLLQLAYGTPKELTVYAVSGHNGTTPDGPTAYILTPVSVQEGDALPPARPSVEPLSDP